MVSIVSIGSIVSIVSTVSKVSTVSTVLHVLQVLQDLQVLQVLLAHLRVDFRAFFDCLKGKCSSCHECICRRKRGSALLKSVLDVNGKVNDKIVQPLWAAPVLDMIR